jgi:hypothetical protein
MLFQTIGGAGGIGPTSGGKVTPINTVGATFTQVIGQNPSRATISFHNPGTVNLLVGPMMTATGAPNTPTAAAPGGAYLLYPGGVIQLDGECQNAYGALAASGGGNPLTITESNT